MLDDAPFSKKYWACTDLVAVYLKIHTATRYVVGKTLYEAWHGRRPLLKHLHVFGWLPFVHVLKEK
jgi:hypothetical protein